jgi:pentatricopeptide repeat domain-containing protein 1
VVTLSAAISVCEKGGQWERALGLFESMKGRGLQPNITTLNAAIEAVDAASQYQSAMDKMIDARACGFYSKAWSKKS